MANGKHPSLLYVERNRASIMRAIVVFASNQTLSAVATEEHQPSGQTDRTKVQQWQNTNVYSMFPNY